MPRVLPSEVVRIIERYYPWVADPGAKPAKLDYMQSGRISAIVSLVDRLPEDLITLGPSEYADFIDGVEVLRSRVPYWAEHGSSTSFNGEPVRSIYQLLQKCPDQYPPPSVHDLSFVDDADLRDELRLDIASAEGALSTGDWKGSTVIAGSVVEALLLWKLSEILSRVVDRRSA